MYCIKILQAFSPTLQRVASETFSNRTLPKPSMANDVQKHNVRTTQKLFRVMVNMREHHSGD